MTRLDSSVSLMHHDPNVLGSLILIQIIPKERSLNVAEISNSRQRLNQIMIFVVTFV